MIPVKKILMKKNKFFYTHRHHQKLPNYRRNYYLTHKESSIVNEVIRTISILFIFFYEKTLSIKKAPKRKTNDFHLLRNFYAPKNLLSLLFLFACFCFVVWFWIDLRVMVKWPVQHISYVSQSKKILPFPYTLFWETHF